MYKVLKVTWVVGHALGLWLIVVYVLDIVFIRVRVYVYTSFLLYILRVL
jgi:hypothetical protein